MSGNVADGPFGGGSVTLDTLPKTVLQSLYHAVTGKTENLSAQLRGNVIITDVDIDNLFQMILDQLNLYSVAFGPTVTVVVKHANNRSSTYSSWERFKALRVNDYEITSDLTLRLEFLLQLPQTSSPQRCTLDINLDSSLPVIRKREDREDDIDPYFGYFLAMKWSTVKLSIDFVDFLVAKAFGAVVEEWFKNLLHAPSSQFDLWLLRNQIFVHRTLQQTGRLGMAAFLAAYTLFEMHKPLSLARLTFAVAIALIIWSVAAIVEAPMTRLVMRRIIANVTPTVILLSTGDQRCYDEVLRSRTTAGGTVARFVGGLLVGLSTNVAASYFYTYVTGK